MKKRLKGLVSLWLVVVMVCSMMTVPAMAADPVYVMVYTGDTSPVPGEWHDSYEYVDLIFDTPLVQQDEIMAKLPIPAGGVLNGWRLWSANSGGLVYENVDPVTIEKDDGIAYSTWSSLADNMNDYLMIEQLWTMKYRIKPQPEEEDPTVGGEVYDEANTTWSKTEDVTYQWYEVTTDSKDYTVVETASADDQLSTTTIYEGSYADGIWNSTDNGVLDILFSVQAGDVVTVTPSDGFSGSVKEYYSYTEYTAANGSYTMTTTADGAHDLYITSTSSEAFTATVTVTRSATTYTLLNGQTTKTLDLTKIEAGTYACELTFNPSKDNVVMMSDTVTYTEEELTPNYIVWVGGQGMYASTDGTVVTYYTNGADGAAGTVSETEPDVWNAKLYYDAANSVYTLEINGLDATGIADDADSIGAGIYSTVPLTIDMTGENHVTGDVYNYRAHGVYVAGALTFQGTGSLEAKAKDSLSYAYSRSIGVYTTGLLSVNGGTLTAAAGQAKGVSSGVFVYQFTMNGGTLSTSSASSEAGVSAAKSEGIYSYKDITINGGTICAVSGYGSVASHGIASDHNIMINDGTISAVAGDSNEDQSRGIYAFGVLTIIDGTVTGVAGSSKQDFSEGVGGAKGVVILGGEVEATGGDNSLVSIGLCSDADMTIGEDAVIRASAGSARKYSYGTFVMDDFHMSGEAFLQTYSDKTTDEPTDAKIPRSIGLYCGATSSTDPDDMDPYDEPATPVVDDTFTITGGTLEAWCTTSPDSTSTENYAVKMFDVVNDDFIFSDTAQPNDTWYKWTLETDDTGAPVNMIWSTKTQYVHADDKENYKSTYLYITPMEEIHEVTFDSMGGSEITPNPIEVENGAKVAKPADPTKANHSFLGWFTSEDNGVTFSEKAYEFDTPVVSDFTLYAQWVKQYTVKYELNGGTGAEGVDYTTQTVDEGTKITVKAEPSLAGHRFDCWSDGTNEYAADDEITVESDITLTAQWVKQYTVKYELNGGTGAEGVDYTTQTVDEGTEITVKEDPSKKDNRFFGWYDGKDYYMLNGEDKITVTGNITLTAKWVPLFTVTLDCNDPTNELVWAIENILEDETANQTLSRQLGREDPVDAGEYFEPSRTGYTFGGWYTDKGVWENEYDFDSKVTADITVYAKWTANSYTVRFNANGGKGTMADQSFTYDVAQNLTSNDFTRDGYTFIGWAENESGDVKYTDGQSVKNLTYAKDGTVDLYAKWEEAAPPVVDPPVIDPPVVISGTASLTKVDAEDPATVLSGVVFELHRLDGALMGTYTTNAYTRASGGSA